MAVALRATLVDALASSLEPQVNAFLRSMPHGSYAEKQALAAWLNHELHHELGLTIRCPRTGRAAILLADMREADDADGRFRLETHDEAGRKTRTYTSATLPQIQLMADPPRREALFRWPKGPAKGSQGR